MLTDIQNRSDLTLLMERFYSKLLAEPSISYLFTDVARINLEEHLPILVDFWEMVLFQADSYRKNVMQLHLHLNELSPLSEQHFTTWLTYFTVTVDELFAGEKAELAKQRAVSIATMMRIKISQAKLRSN